MIIDPKHKVLYHINSLFDLKVKGKTNAPVNVEIDLSNRCSHGCSWCHFAYTHTKGLLAGSDKPEGYIDTGDLFDFELLKQVLNQLRTAGVKSVTWTGGGEPTLHPMFKEIIEFTSDLGLDQGMYTHGGHVTKELAALLKQKLIFVYVSLDECTAEDFKQSKGVNRFKNVLEGIVNLGDAEGTCTVGVGFLLHEYNYTKINEMIELGRALQPDYIQFRPVIDYDLNNPSKLKVQPSWITELPEIQDEFIIYDKSRFEYYLSWQGHDYQTCHWSSMQTVITPNGKMWRCVNKRGFPDALMGDLSQQSFREIWDTVGYSCQVNDQCRVMCRGHLANQTLDKVLNAKTEHINFI